MAPSLPAAKVWRYTPGERALTLLAVLPCEAVPSCIAIPGALAVARGAAPLAPRVGHSVANNTHK